jgi:DNA-binding CsgD family transcriptional regulator
MVNHLLELTSALSHLDLVKNNIENILETTTISAYWKDKNGVYLGVNHTFLNISDMRSLSDVVGKKDRDLPWIDHAPILEMNDRGIMRSGKPNTMIEQVKFYGGGGSFLSHKTPLTDAKGKVIGIFGLSCFFDNDGMEEKTDLTSRQIECLLLLVKGMTMKQIAFHLKLSVRTVEHYIESIKIKLNCDKKSDLIMKALKMKIIRSQI